MTEAQRQAFNWLADHNGDGLFDKNGVLVAAGERAPFMRSTWNALADLGVGEFYGPSAKPRARYRLTRSSGASQ